MKLSVVIVNYNVRFFLEQCLQSVFRAIKNTEAEVFVVDNNSVDGSVSMVKEKFPAAVLIENESNTGFSAANNQAIKIAAGEFILLLNPDTVVEEDTFTKCLEYLENHPEAGALGVKMIDGKGNFLPESKRGLPTPWTAFYKIFGISRLFPGSKRFGKYHLSYLGENTVNEVDVLCGAFMMVRKEAFRKAGLLDEAFFMYGEDIDLSYRIQKAGYKIIYYPQSTIIHYKGESTKKSSLNYVYLFYKAMQIFAVKHLTGKSLWWLKFFVQLAIVLRASLAVLKRSLTRILLPACDAMLIVSGMIILSRAWGWYWFANPDYYAGFYFSMLPVYAGIWLLSLLFTGAYDSPLRIKDALSGITAGTIIILVIYALMPKNYQYSRVLVLSGALLALGVTILNRILLSFFASGRFVLTNKLPRKIVIAGSAEECERVRTILQKVRIQPQFLAFVSAERDHTPYFTGSLDQLKEIVKIYKINEIIFCLKDIKASSIINEMLNLSDCRCDFKIAPANADSIIGSNSINTAGDLYVYNANPVVSAKNRRIKRTFDFSVSFILIFLFPLWAWFVNQPLKMLESSLVVLAGRKTWIGYSHRKKHIKPGIFSIYNSFPEAADDEKIIDKLELAYAQDYRVFRDFQIFIRAFFSLI